MTRKSIAEGTTMLELWRPPRGAGDPVGCVSTTFTFTPSLFDEQCLQRFLGIESEPDREDLAFLLEREHRLGSVYAGIFVDASQAGVSHSLRWDILAVRIPGAKQHAKLSILAWSRLIRVVVTSANLTEAGYRNNQEVTAFVDLVPEAADKGILADALKFLRQLLYFVPSTSRQSPETLRAGGFLSEVERLAKPWSLPPITSKVTQRLSCTLPKRGTTSARSSLDEAISICGNSPKTAWIASPFFDVSEPTRAVLGLCERMAPRGTRELFLNVPHIAINPASNRQRIAAPRELFEAPHELGVAVRVELLPNKDVKGNVRPWHAKLMALFNDKYSAVMIGSSNFTNAGLGLVGSRNAEVNLLSIVKRISGDRLSSQLLEVWPDVEMLDEPASAEWLGASAETEEESMAAALAPPSGFISATYRAGTPRQIILYVDSSKLPPTWSVSSIGSESQLLFDNSTLPDLPHRDLFAIDWSSPTAPEKLVVRWSDHEAFLALNVEVADLLPPPHKLNEMTADDMLLVLAASDPSAAFRLWARRQLPSELNDDELDVAVSNNLDPLRRYDLQATFLHRIRRRARLLTRVRVNLERPAWSAQAVEWRLRGLIGVQPMANRLLKDVKDAGDDLREPLLLLADLLVILREVDYKTAEGAMTSDDFYGLFQPFLSSLAKEFDTQIVSLDRFVPADVAGFWKRIVTACKQ